MQADSLAKVHNPEADNVVYRKRLFQTLDLARKKRIVWITGLPGSGKTTLVASYLSAKRLFQGWYHLDSSDKDLATFFYYLRHIVKGKGSAQRSLLPLLTPEYLLNIETYTRRYFESLYGMLPEGFVLVFDNYHEVEDNPLFHFIMSEALMRIPEYGNVIVISRTEPPGIFSRLRANSIMEIVDNEMLKFTPEETSALIKLHSGKDHNNEAVTRLHNWTDGWAAGIVLMLEQHNMGLDAAEKGGLKDYQSIFDYFSAEIFDRLEPKTRDFLLRTSFFPSMTIEMADRMTESSASEKILNLMVKYQYFTIRHQDNTYTYHDLFREFLQARTKMYFKEAEVGQIYKHAALILRENGKVDDAVELYAKAGSREDIRKIITANARDLISQGRNIVLELWMQKLSEKELNQDPWLLYWLGEARAVFNPVEGRAYFEKAFKKFIENVEKAEGVYPVRKKLSDGVYLAWCGIIETFFFEFGNYKQAEKWIKVMEKIMTGFPGFSSRELEGRVLSLMVQVLTFQRPMHPKIETWAERALSLLEYIKDPDLCVYYLSYITNYYSWTGNIVKFDMLINLMKSIAKPESLPVRTKLLYQMFMAVHARHLSLKEPCLSAVHEALAIADKHGVHYFDHLIMAQAVYLLLGTGDIKKIEEFLHRMGPSVNQSSLLEVIQYSSMLGWLDKLHGNMQSATEKIEHSLKLALKMGSPFPEAIHRIALAELYYTAGDFKTAARHLRRSFFLGKKMKSHMLEYMSYLLKAYWLLDDKVFYNEANGLKLLRKAMVLGKKYDIINTFLETRQIRTQLCMKALEKGIEVQYVHKLIKRLELRPDAFPMNYEDWPWAFKFYTLGSFKIFNDGMHIELSKKAQHKPVELLQFLIVNQERAVGLDQICSALWPEVQGDYAHQALDITIHRLRKLLGSNDAVMSQSGRLMLNPKKCWVDVSAYEYLLNRIETLLAGTDKSTASSDKQEEITVLERRIFNMYRGDFFTQDVIPSWAIGFREKLHDRFLHFVEMLGGHYESTESRDQAVLTYKKGLEIDNHVELFYQRLMVLYKSLGRYAEAAATYKRCETALSQALDIKPSDKTTQIYQSIRP